MIRTNNCQIQTTSQIISMIATINVRGGKTREMHKGVKSKTSIADEEEAEPDQATFQRWSAARERSSRARNEGREVEEERERVCCRVWMRGSGRETKQLSSPPTNLTSNSIAFFQRVYET